MASMFFLITSVRLPTPFESPVSSSQVVIYDIPSTGGKEWRTKKKKINLGIVPWFYTRFKTYI